MEPSLRTFLNSYIGTVCATLMPVVVTAFLTIPLNLGGHPGEPRLGGTTVAAHMT